MQPKGRGTRAYGNEGKRWAEYYWLEVMFFIPETYRHFCPMVFIVISKAYRLNYYTLHPGGEKKIEPTVLCGSPLKNLWTWLKLHVCWICLILRISDPQKQKLMILSDPFISIYSLNMHWAFTLPDTLLITRDSKINKRASDLENIVE